MSFLALLLNAAATAINVVAYVHSARPVNLFFIVLNGALTLLFVAVVAGEF